MKPPPACCCACAAREPFRPGRSFLKGAAHAVLLVAAVIGLSVGIGQCSTARAAESTAIKTTTADLRIDHPELVGKTVEVACLFEQEAMSYDYKCSDARFSVSIPEKAFPKEVLRRLFKDCPATFGNSDNPRCRGRATAVVAKVKGDRPAFSAVTAVEFDIP